jgi:electron transfer flavoprotein alpha subunit
MSRSAWFLAELASGALTRTTVELAAAAAALADGGRPVAVLFAADAADAEPLAAAGCDVLVVDIGAAGQDPVTHGRAIAALLADGAPDVLLVPANAAGRDLAGTVQGLADVAVLANAEAVGPEGDGLACWTSAFGDRLRVRLAAEPGTTIVLARPGIHVEDAPAPAPAGPGPGAVRLVRPEVPPSPVRVLERRPAVTAGIERARILVCAGRGVGGPDGLAVAADLADAIGGALAASRAAVDSGWIDYAHQVGQTGQRVTPELYVGLGVSGATAHAAGMRRSRTIVAVNRDPEAPIAELADLFVVGDLFEIAPRLATALRAR